MLRSLSYAAYTALYAFIRTRPEDFSRLEPWTLFWQHWTSVSFLRSYLGTAAGASFLPPQRRDLEVLLEAMIFDKVLYEIRYELNNRLDWVHIPLQGVLRLLQGVPLPGSPQVLL
jgi:maltose alpha-D-glucosyltransferase/alpha-amylase